MSSLYLLEDDVYFALQTSGVESTIAMLEYKICILFWKTFSIAKYHYDIIVSHSPYRNNILTKVNGSSDKYFT